MVSAPPKARPTASPEKRRRKGRLRRFSRRKPVRIIALLLVLLAGWTGWSLGQALTAPGGDDTVARVAEWARDHHLGPIVTGLENLQYQLNPPSLGGEPSIAMAPVGSPDAPSSTGAPTPTKSSAGKPSAAQPAPSSPPAIQAISPPPLVSPAASPLPNEGTWRVLGKTKGTPSLLGAYVRPDAAHTSYVAAVTSMDSRLVRFQLHPGSNDPGAGKWGVPASLPPAARRGLLATFNGGFKVEESGGGFFLNGVTRGKLTNGIASLVFYKDGHVTVGVWGRDVSMTPDVVGVRQNLKPLVDHSSVPASVDSNVQLGWGKTIGGKAFVWRSGVGITADKRIVYAYGPALSVRALGDLLKRAGCVEAMQLDINPAWMSFMSYVPTADPTKPTPVKLLDGQVRAANRYFDTTSRDFVAVYAR